MVSHSPLKWFEVRKYSFEKPPEIVLGRSQKIDTDYQMHTQNLKDKNIAVYDNLKNLYFQGKSKGFVITKNGFPYYLEDTVQHYLIWVDPQYTGQDQLSLSDKEAVRQVIQQRFFPAHTQEDMERLCVYFQNIPRMRSVKCMPHVHVFVKM